MSPSKTDLEPLLSTTLGAVKQRLAETFGVRLRDVILYGSRARGDSGKDSDVDLMVILEPRLDGDQSRASSSVYDFVLDSGYLLSVRTVDAEVFRRGEFYLYRSAKREGIVL